MFSSDEVEIFTNVAQTEVLNKELFCGLPCRIQGLSDLNDGSSVINNLYYFEF